MWFTPWRRSRASCSSARSWPIEPRAAAPKRTRVLSCPVRPNGAVASAPPPAVVPSSAVPDVTDLPYRPSPGDGRPGPPDGTGSTQALHVGLRRERPLVLAVVGPADGVVEGAELRLQDR